MRKVAELWLLLVAVSSVIMGYFIGSFHKIQIARLNYNVEDNKHMIKFDSNSDSAPDPDPAPSSSPWFNTHNTTRVGLFDSAPAPSSSQWFKTHNTTRVYAATNPRGAESLPPGIVEPYSDFYPHRHQENSSEDLVGKPKYLLALAVGYDQKDIINEIIMKFSENFSIVLFHYDGRTSEWDQFEWSHSAIHISASKQAKWWYAKRFLHPDIVSIYECIFIWDEDLGVKHFNAEEYLKLVQKHDLEISQPGIESKHGWNWLMTKRRDGTDVHKKVEEKPGKCHDKHQPPCAGFVEIMAPVFSKKSWRCVWHMIQNDLIHGWGLDFALWRCVERPHEMIGVVDAQWLEHKGVPSLVDQGISNDTRSPRKGVWARWGLSNDRKSPREGVWKRCKTEWREFERRMYNAEHGVW